MTLVSEYYVHLRSRAHSGAGAESGGGVEAGALPTGGSAERSSSGESSRGSRNHLLRGRLMCALQDRFMTHHRRFTPRAAPRLTLTAPAATSTQILSTDMPPRPRSPAASAPRAADVAIDGDESPASTAHAPAAASSAGGAPTPAARGRQKYGGGGRADRRRLYVGHRAHGECGSRGARLMGLP